MEIISSSPNGTRYIKIENTPVSMKYEKTDNRINGLSCTLEQWMQAIESVTHANAKAERKRRKENEDLH